MEALATELKDAKDRGEPDDGSRYYLHWLAALERLVAAKGLADTDALLPARKLGPMLTGTPRTESRSSCPPDLNTNRRYRACAAAGLPNFAASIETFGCTSVSVYSSRPLSQP
jgi:hypothetical protein